MGHPTCATSRYELHVNASDPNGLQREASARSRLNQATCKQRALQSVRTLYKMTPNTSTGINPHTMEPMRIREISTLQNSTHHQVSDVPSCSHIISFMVTRLDHTEGATQTHSPKQENAEVMETIYRSIIHPKANETTPCTTATETRENVSIKLPPTNYQ